MVDGWRLDELLADQMQREQVTRQHTKNQLAWLDEARARAGGRYEAVRVRVAPDQIEQVQRAAGSLAQVDQQAGADGRRGINILYNARASSGQVSEVLDLVQARGGEVFERPQDATYREQQARQDRDRLAGRQLGRSQDRERD